MDTVFEISDKLHQNHPHLMGRTYAFFAGSSVAFMSIFMRLIGKQLFFLPIVGIQNALGSIFTIAIFGGLLKQSIFHPETEISYKIFLRGLLGSSLFILHNYALRTLPPQKMIVLANTLSIWVVILSAFFLKEYPNRTIIILLCCSLVGVIIMVDPTLIMPDSWVYSEGIDRKEVEYPIHLLLVPILTAFSGACVSVFLKAFAHKLNPYQNVGSFFFFNSFYTGMVWTMFETPEGGSDFRLMDLFFISCVALSQIGFQAFLSLASRYEKRASIIALIMNCQIPVAYILDVIVLSGKLQLVNVLGGLIVMASTTLIAFSKEHQVKAPPEIDDKVQT